MERSERERKHKPFRITRKEESEARPWKERLRQLGEKFGGLLRGKSSLLVLLCLLIMVVDAPSLIIPPRSYHLGELAPFDLKARQDVLVEDREGTEQKKKEAAQAVADVYDFDEEAGPALQRRISQAFQTARDNMKSGRDGAAAFAPDSRSRLEKVWGIELTPFEFNVLAQNRFSPTLEEGLNRIVQSVLAEGVVGNKLALMNAQGKGIVIRKLPSGMELRIREIERFPDLDEARDRLEKRSAYLLTGIRGDARRVAISLAQKLIAPNLTLNKKGTELRRERAVQQTRPVFSQIKKGEVIVREGQRIDEAALVKLQGQLRKQGLEVLVTSIGLACLLGVFFFMAYRMIISGCRMAVDNWRDLAFLTALLALSFLSIRTADLVTQILVSGVPAVNPRSALLAIPLAAAPMMISLALGAQVSILFTLVQASLVALFLEGGPGLALYFAVAGLWTSQSQRISHKRWDLLRLGLVLGGINLASLAALRMMENHFFYWDNLADMVFGVSGGVLTGVVVTGFSPLVEKLFGYTTEMGLLERASMDQPLLRELTVQAPGPYHHSIIVGNMVEAAAEAIGAKPLLARVSAYYHDIGKTQKPQYFIENQPGGENKHEKLAPSMSSLILISHVKDGVEMARQAKLEEPIIDIIQQHHGTRLISFFYQKALELKGGDPAAVSMEDFRYPGPKPQTKEAGLVMLADAIEAASRTLVDPTPARIQGLVHRIINDTFSDGQLDECEITLKDLNRIAVSFNKILNGIFHHRIEYPGSAAKPPTGRKKTDGDTDRQPAETDQSRPGGKDDDLLLPGLGAAGR
ncbi:MAG: HDIG domain-containing protein [Deltaproteobacteria bacterium]|nr:HDIG domain-containing protein [Deltaproteobacteria bacterium]